MLSIAACENDLKEVERVSSKKIAIPVDKSINVEIIYSDSAVVKAKLITPELLHYKTDRPYQEMQKGVTIIFYDQFQKETSRIKSDYAIRRESEKLVEFRKNVVATNTNGETFKSEELIWDENKKHFYSNQTVEITTKTSTIFGLGFEANEKLYPWTIKQATGNFDTPQKSGLRF